MNILLIGAERGIGATMAQQLSDGPDAQVIKTSRQYAALQAAESGQWTVHCDLQDPTSMSRLAEQLTDQFDRIDWLINCAGVLHNDQYMPEKSLKQVNQAQMIDQFLTNAVGHLLLLQATQGLLTQGHAAVVASISARIGSIGDNHLGGWYAYRMSKAALNMGLRTTAIEWARQVPQVKFLLLHPGTTDTDLSKPFQQRLPAGQLQSPATTAQLLLQQIRKHQHHPHKYPLYLDHHGNTVPW
ncbi:SDR family NAD(P)-dependent oxidoreductase [Marinicella meishanensis]|uniref:SDR family NAD(P)-dependent oxidoreductase n=1 Tax=Marinicella meishanensis TaxID=2873263 RepID=UPI001CBC79E0|nr:SDR family NAD(P)-dependent oxidoreductase [Marinicella sp. NBU2979]